MSSINNSKSQYDTIIAALSSNDRLVYDNKEKKFVSLSKTDAKRYDKGHYTTDLWSLKNKVVQFIDKHGIDDQQKNKLLDALVYRATPNMASFNPIRIFAALQFKFIADEVEIKPTSLYKKVEEELQTEKNYENTLLKLDNLYKDDKFKQILKEKGLEQQIDSLSDSFKDAAEASNKYQSGLQEVKQLVQNRKDKAAQKKYFELIEQQFPHYIQQQTRALKNISHASNPKICQKLKNAEKKYRAEHSKSLFGQETLSDWMITVAQVPPRHKLFAERINPTAVKKMEPLLQAFNKSIPKKPS